MQPSIGIVRQSKILRLIALIQSGLALISTTYSLIKMVEAPSPGFLRSLIGTAAWLAACLLALWLVRKNSVKLLRIGTYILLGVQTLGTFVVLNILRINESPTPLLYLIIVIIASSNALNKITKNPINR